MKAVFLRETGWPEVLEWGEVDLPLLREDEVLVQNYFIGLNFADIYRRKGDYAIAGPRPFILGYEGAGVIAQIGRQVQGFKRGDRVAYVDVPRSNAEFTACPAQKLIALPNEIRFADAAGILLQGLSAQMLANHAYELKAKQTALVLAAASGVGLLLLQQCRRKGVHTLALVSNESKIAAVKDSGANEVYVVDEKQKSPLLDLSLNSKAIDVVYDSLGSTLKQSLSRVRKGGTVVYYAWAGGAPLALSPDALLNESKTLTGADLWNFIEAPEDLQRESANLFRDLQEQKISLKIAKCFDLAQAGIAHRLMESRSAVGKILFITEAGRKAEPSACS